MLNDNDIPFTYREYTRDPLTAEEIRSILGKLDMGPRDVLRSRDAKKAGIDASVADDALIAMMVENPRLLQRPIGVRDDRAAVGRPVENLLVLRD